MEDKSGRNRTTSAAEDEKGRIETLRDPEATFLDTCLIRSTDGVRAGTHYRSEEEGKYRNKDTK